MNLPNSDIGKVWEERTGTEHVIQKRKRQRKCLRKMQTNEDASVLTLASLLNICQFNKNQTVTNIDMFSG